MTLILTIATLALLTFLGFSCRRARLDLEDQLCECAQAPMAAAAGFGPSPVELVPLPPVLIALDGGLPGGPGVPPGKNAARATGGRGGRRVHLQVVESR
jgi:hypothetical protein